MSNEETPQQGQTIQPQQTPFSFTVGTAKDEKGDTKAILRLDTLLGPLHFFMEPAMMKFIGQVLMHHATQMETVHTGLVVPGEAAIKQITKPGAGSGGSSSPFKVVP
jgi:hypothetical protein